MTTLRKVDPLKSILKKVKVADLFFYTPLHGSWLHVGRPCVCPSVCLAVSFMSAYPYFVSG